MSKTRAQLRTDVQDNIGRTDKTTVINSRLNDGLKEIAKAHHFRDLLPVAADVSVTSTDLYVALPTGTLWVRTVRLINGSSSYPLKIVTRKRFEEHWPDVASVNTYLPTECFIDLKNSRLYFAPMANSTYTLRFTCIAEPSDFASDSATNPIKNTDLALVAWTTAEVFRSIGQHEDAEIWENIYNKRLFAAITADSKDNVDREAQEFTSEEVSPLNPWENPFDKG